MIRLPAEWEPQQAVLLSFPRRGGDWGAILSAASSAMIEAAKLISSACPVILIVGDKEHYEPYAPRFTGQVVYLPTDDCWIRDSGPLTVFTPAPTLLDFTFNGWGGKFSAENDNRVPLELHRRLFPAVGYERIPFVLEGGAIETDGQGTFLTTSRCLLSEGRNDFASKAAAEKLLHGQLGAERIIWLDHGELIGDDTDAHVDTVARFLDARTIAYVGPPPPEDPHYADFMTMREELQERATGYDLLELPWASAVVSQVDGHRLPVSYANFLISNGTLFLPVYGIDTDAAAIKLLQDRGPYRVEPIDCLPFVEQHGALHCLTMQIPTWPDK
ncbi:agmatine deiminase [Neolewinella xylanilytica]|uniref:Agmatine deiminase n=1 Tax=Neolewinella xylanilytica TaxID=1514080 RepID=A0A2S6I6D9_9BACT|nr:agmatine deiminase family protein [Neolewinella xylanilytica]PPK86699.1 agmatine deiminase [Neolewinella xylanilytica]